jgi:PAS domain S-box-containing protein
VNSFVTPSADALTAPRPLIDRERLVRAIEYGEIFPAFQQIVALPSGGITGFEVLARWHDDEMGAVQPQHFIQLAERAGLMTPLMLRLVDSACTAALAWDGNFRLAFNLSPIQLQDDGLPARIEQTIRRTGFPMSRIQLEITESALIDDLDAARRSLARLKSLGVKVALDDFGTGFSCLAWLRALPVDALKVDASFVRSMTVSRDSRKIVSAVIGLGQSLGMPVIAEGVETRSEAHLLTGLGCDFGQGYLFGRPSHAEFIPAILRAQGEHTHETAPLNLSCNLRLAQLNAIYASAPFALCFIDMSCRFVSANERYAELIGVDRSRIIGRPVGDVRPDLLPLVRDILAAAAAGGTVPTLECMTPDGSRNLLSTISAARDENDEVVGVSAAIVDCTRFKSTPPTRAFGKRSSGACAPGSGS